MEEFLKNPKGFLITDITSFNGAQARNIIVYTDEIAGKFLRNMVLRSLSFLILICEETKVRSSYGLKEDRDLYKFISKDSEENCLSITQYQLELSDASNYP